MKHPTSLKSLCTGIRINWANSNLKINAMHTNSTQLNWHMKKCRKHFHLLLHANFDSARTIAAIRVTDHNDLFDGLKIYNKCIVSCGIFLTTAIPILDLEHGFECLPGVLLPIIWITRQKVRIDIDCTHVLAERVFCNQQ